jgi:uncharacterized membrane protein/thiol-disulfide isomerase/thioredoxin
LTGLSALGLALSAYLGWHYLVGGSVIGCGGGSTCEQVLSSRWSTVAGLLPVSGLAAGTFLAMLVASFFIGPATAAPDRRLAWSAMLVLVGAAAGSAVWFIILQRWVIGAFCPYCMATHVTGLLLAALVVWRAPMQFDGDSTDVAAPQSAIGTLPAIGRAMIGLALAGILAACQVVFAPPPVYRAGESQNTRPAIDPHAVPLVGSPDAPYVVTLLFDYKCSHCQKIHSMLDEAIRRYDGKLAFALCPAPLSNQCNPYIARYVEEFKDSCELAKVGLAVWVANREAFVAFDRWMFSPEPGQLWRSRSLDSARAKAVELVGQAKFDAASADPWIDRFMQSSIRIFGDTINPDQSGSAVPKLVFGPRWVTPDPHDANDLLLILHDSLTLPRP